MVMRVTFVPSGVSTWNCTIEFTFPGLFSRAFTVSSSVQMRS